LVCRFVDLILDLTWILCAKMVHILWEMCLNPSGLLLCLPPIPATTGQYFGSDASLLLWYYMKYCGAETQARGLLAIAPKRYCYCCC
ncbi:hypothetical protein ES332_A13G150300v1, partial [Gossypium tomentosum]